MDAGKVDFLKYRFIPLLKELPSGTPPTWGKMTVQQMIEHLSDSVRIASGKATFSKIFTPEEQLPKMQEFLMSEKPFRPDTVNPLLPKDPAPVTRASVAEAIKELDSELQHFFSVFAANPHLTTINPLFGTLNFEMNVQLLYKHTLHHLKQFGQTAV